MQVLCGLQVLFLLFNCQTPVKCKKDFLLRRFYFFSIYPYHAGLLYLHTGHRLYLIYFHSSCFDQAVRLPAGTNARIAEIFIQTHILCPSCYLMKYYYTAKQGAKRAFMLIWRLPMILAALRLVYRKAGSQASIYVHLATASDTSRPAASIPYLFPPCLAILVPFNV